MMVLSVRQQENTATEGTMQRGGAIYQRVRETLDTAGATLVQWPCVLEESLVEGFLGIADQLYPDRVALGAAADLEGSMEGFLDDGVVDRVILCRALIHLRDGIGAFVLADDTRAGAQLVAAQALFAAALVEVRSL